MDISWWRRFSALAAALVLQGCTLAPASAPGPFVGVREAPAGPVVSRLSSRQEPLKSRVEQVTHEFLGPNFEVFDRDSVCLVPRRELEANPPLKYCDGCSNCLPPVLENWRAQKATEKLFEAWGIALKPQVRVSGPGYDFVADGYNETSKIGFKILQPEASKAELKPISPGGDLSQEELRALDRDVERGALRIFVVDGKRFERGATALAFHIASVIDYLNWVHGDREIDLHSVLGQADPKGEQP